MAKSLTPQDISRLRQLVTDGCQVFQEIEDLNEGLSETVKAIAEELDIKPAQLKKVIKIAFKATLADEREKFEELEDILSAIGRG
jgi:hypothetical protein